MPPLTTLAIIGGLAASLAGAIFLGFRQWRERRRLDARLEGIPELDAEKDKLLSEIANAQTDLTSLRASYREKQEIYQRLESAVAVYDEKLSFAELGVYEPHFDFIDTEEYKAAIKTVRAEQKDMVSAKRAVTCNTPWRVDGSLSKGQTMINRQIRLTLRAFNNECEAAIANARWNNVNAMEKRIRNASTQIDKMNASQDVRIEPRYLELKLRELFLTHEYREAQKREKDERAEVARLAREEQKLIKEAEKAEREEERYRQLLEKARAEIENAVGGNAEEMKAQIAKLEKDLEEAHAVSERARSMAQMTRSGYVYIISNVGSFGEDMVKIGLTRRLDPEDRVRELGDASVPFRFDTHALIYSDDAPALEAALHSEFDAQRVNAANYRKEFFRVALEEVEEAVRRLAPSSSFFKNREAQEYHETLARRRDEAARLKAQAAKEFPAEI